MLIDVFPSAIVAVANISANRTNAEFHNADDRIVHITVRSVHTQLQTRGVGTRASQRGF